MSTIKQPNQQSLDLIFPTLRFGIDGAGENDATINSALTHELYEGFNMDVVPKRGATAGLGWMAEVRDAHIGETMIDAHIGAPMYDRSQEKPNPPVYKPAHYAFRAGEGELCDNIGTSEFPIRDMIRRQNGETVDGLRGRSFVIIRLYQDNVFAVSDKGVGVGANQAFGVYRIIVWVDTPDLDPREIAHAMEQSYLQNMKEQFPSYAVLVGKRNYAEQQPA